MGLIVDTNVLINFEKKDRSVDLFAWSSGDELFVSVVTVSELLMGIHRANTPERRQRRSEFVEAIIQGVNILPIDLAVARVHAEIYSELATAGQLIGAHDLLIAASALQGQHGLLTDNVQEFTRIRRLQVVPFIT